MSQNAQILEMLKRGPVTAMDDFIGKKFNALTVIGPTNMRQGNAVLWHCVCECGNDVFRPKWFIQNKLKSCGCKTKQILSDAHKRHGETDTPTWRSWKSMHERCYMLAHKSFSQYGGRGIIVCDRWHTYENFRADMGVRPNGSTLGRIDNDGIYEPGNCRWETPKQQARNRRSSTLLTHDGKTMCVTAWADETGLPHTTIAARLKKGWDPIRALTQPRRNQPLHHQLKEAA